MSQKDAEFDFDLGEFEEHEPMGHSFVAAVMELQLGGMDPNSLPPDFLKTLNYVKQFNKTNAVEVSIALIELGKEIGLLVRDVVFIQNLRLGTVEEVKNYVPRSRNIADDILQRLIDDALRK